MKNKLLILLAIGAISYSCKKKDVTTPNSGIYRGVFREFTETDTLAEGVVHIALFESDYHFQMSGDSTSLAPASHAGTFNINGSSTIIFDNTSVYNQLYDVDNYLDTLYNYKFDNVNFELWQTWQGKTYEYIMVRD